MTLWIADISGNNANYNSFIKNNDAVIIKISEGLSYINPLANAQYQAVKKAGKKIGFYHFLVGGLDARKQAEYFYNNAKNYLNEDGAVLALDFERPSGYPALTGNEPKAFLDRLYELTGKRGLLYISTSDFISNAYDWSDIKNDYGLWIAGYPLNNGAAFSNDLQEWANNSNLYFANKKYDGYTVVMWQYDSVPYDRSIAYLDGNGWVKYGTKAGKSNSNTNNNSSVKQDRQFKNDEKVKLKSYAYASAYGTKFNDAVKKAYGRVAWVTNEKRSVSNQIVKVGFLYNNEITYWNVLAQDLDYVKE